MAAPAVLHTYRGFQFIPEAAAALARADAAWQAQGNAPLQISSGYRDYDKQMGMYVAWQRYKSGDGPHPGHSMALHPDLSDHCRGCALDTASWGRPGFIALMADHGWIRTAPSDPTEQHHFVYFANRDNHRGEAAPAGSVGTEINNGPAAEDGETGMAFSEEAKDTLDLMGQSIKDDVRAALPGLVRDALLAANPAGRKDKNGNPISLGSQIVRASESAQKVEARGAIELLLYNLEGTDEATRRAALTSSTFQTVGPARAAELRERGIAIVNVTAAQWDQLRSARTVLNP